MKLFLLIKERKLWNNFWAILITALFALPVYLYAIYFTRRDFFLHFAITSSIIDRQYHNVPALPNPVYHLLLTGIHLILFRQTDIQAIALFVQIFAQALLALLFYFWLGREGQMPDWFRIAFAVSLSLVTPVMALAFWDNLYYFGYIGIATYHNPTIHLLKPIAWLAFIYLLPIFDITQEVKTGTILVSAFLTVLSALVKPNYLLCILPAVGIIAVIRLTSKKPIRWRLLIFGLFLPATLILLVQFMMLYGLRNGEEGGIVFAPFGMVREHSAYLLPKLILSILFPLSVLILDFRKVLRDPALSLAWTGFLVSLAQTYFLAESGERFPDGNFGWGSEIMLLILFVTSVSFLWHERMSKQSWLKPGNMVILTAYLAHAVAGLAYWVYAMQTKGPW